MVTATLVLSENSCMTNDVHTVTGVCQSTRLVVAGLSQRAASKKADQDPRWRVEGGSYWLSSLVIK